MSTPRTRHQNRSSAPNSQNQSNPLAKKISAIVIVSVLLCIISVIAKNLYPEIVPNKMIPKILGLTFLVIIFTVVKFVITQYKTLKNTYQNLEQTLQETAMYGNQQIDYVEYPQYGQQQYGQPMYPQQNYPQGYQQDYRQGYLPQYNQAYNQQPQRKKKGLLFSVIATIVILSALGIVSLKLLSMIETVTEKPTETYIYECVESKVTKASSYEYEETDEDTGSISTVTVYSFDCVYKYNGEEYTLTSSTRSKKITEGDTVYIYLNPDSPQTEILTSFELSEKLIICFSIAVSVEFILLFYLPFKLIKKFARS